MNEIMQRVVVIYFSLCCMYIYAEKQAEISLPPAFGKTHFIVGMPQSDINLLREADDADTATHQSSTYRHAYFSPDDGLEQKLIEIIDREQRSLQIAVFQFTNLEIARAIKRAQQRGVNIELVTDPLCLQDKFNKITWLTQEGLTVYIYNPDANKATLSNKMHHKFVICGKNIDNKKLVWIGSFNFTKSADTANQESVVVLDDRPIVDKFEKQYTHLKERSVKFNDFAKNHFIVQAWRPVDKDSHTTRKRNALAHTKTHKRNNSKEFAAA